MALDITYLPPAEYIADEDAFARLISLLCQESVLAVDTESNSLHAYQGRVCLIQISTRMQDFIIDPLAIVDLSPLGGILADPDIEKIFHAAEYDLLCLKHDFDFDVANLFDTMYAARICQIQPIGLADLLRSFFDVEVDKSHQLDNWGIRPLPSDSLHYAQMDTHFLPTLRDMLYQRLIDMERLEEAHEVFGDVSQVNGRERDFDPDGYWKIGRPLSLNRREMAILRELYLLRDELARNEDVPPFKLMNNKTMASLTQNRPSSMRELGQLGGINQRILRIYGERILAAIAQGQTMRPPNPPAEERVDPVIADRYMILHAWRKDKAIQRGVDSNIVLSKQTLWQIAREKPATTEALALIDGLGTWRLRTYGPELLELLATLR